MNNKQNTQEKLNYQKNNIHKKQKITNNKQRKAIKQKVKSNKHETKNRKYQSNK